MAFLRNSKFRENKNIAYSRQDEYYNLQKGSQ
jgi:hypothetical protein